MDMMEDDYLFTTRYKRHRANKTFFLFSSLISGGFWMQYEFTTTFQLQVFSEEFLSVLSRIEIIICGASLISYFLLKERLKLHKVFLLARNVYYLICLSNISLFLYLFIINTNITSTENKEDFYYLICQVLTVFFITAVLVEECRQQQLIIDHIQNGVLESLRQLLMNNQQEENNSEDEYGRLSVLSVSQSQADPVYGKLCTICDEEIEQDLKVVQLPCLHIFHPECIRKWISIKPFCPNCRFNLEEYSRNINQ